MLDFELRTGIFKNHKENSNIIVKGANSAVYGTKPVFTWQDNQTKSTYHIFGRLDGIRNQNGSISPGDELQNYLKKISNPQNMKYFEGRFIILESKADESYRLWCDKSSRPDIYYAATDDGLIVATDLEKISKTEISFEMDSVGLAHSLMVYGSRPAKKHTLYRRISRLGVGEILLINHNKCRPEKILPIVLASTSPGYTKHDLKRYSDIFIESIRMRGSNDKNVVYLSSGWDSTSILATLVHIYGNRKVSAIIGRMLYSDRSGVINQFELDRAKKITDYYKVELKIVDLDYRSKFQGKFEEMHLMHKSQMFNNLTAANHWILASETSKMLVGGEAVFAGEMSDGAHNLGFSQYTTIFHAKSQEFREYSDKMASYLFGPTFMSQVKEENYLNDPIWKYMMQRYSDRKFDSVSENKNDVAKQFFTSFFLTNGRIPFFSISNEEGFNDIGAKKYVEEMTKIYLEDFSKIADPENLYSCYLTLYNSFHWQSSTVSPLEYSADIHGFSCALPFNDASLIEFLSGMPESWGRGLDLNPTKYPLKWMLNNRIDYPIHLQTGPHSYVYDVKPDFSLIGELLHASSIGVMIKQSLRDGNFIEKLDSEFFNLNYISEIIKSYLNDEELSNSDRSLVANIGVHSLNGIYE